MLGMTVSLYGYRCDCYVLVTDGVCGFVVIDSRVMNTFIGQTDVAMSPAGLSSWVETLHQCAGM